MQFSFIDLDPVNDADIKILEDVKNIVYRIRIRACVKPLSGN